MRRTRGAIGAALAALALVLVGCGANAPSAQSSVSHPSVLTTALGAQVQPVWWYPLWSTTACGGTLFGMEYQDLLWFNSNGSINWSQSVAKSISVNKTDNVFDVHINPIWHWSNGTPVTANDVIFAFNVLKASAAKNAPWAACGLGIGNMPTEVKSMTAVGQDTVQITTIGSVNPTWFEFNAISQLTPVPASVWNKYPNNMTQELSYIKTVGGEPMNANFNVIDGPYKLVKAVPDQYWEFKINPKFSGSPKPTIQTQIYQYETSSTSEFAQLKKGVVQVGAIPFSLLTEAKKLSGYTVKPLYYPGFNYMQPNYSSQAPGIGGLFQQLYFRQAMQLGIDQPAIVQSMYHGYAYPVYEPVPEQPPNTFFDSSLKNPYPYNPAKGKQILEAHGWREVNGVMTKGTTKLAFTFLVASGDQTQTNIAELLKADWAEEGIDVTIKEEPFTQVITNGTQDASQWTLMSWGGGWSYVPDYYPSGDGILNSQAGFNPGGYDNPTMNHLINITTIEGGTPAQIKQRFDQYQEFAAKNLPVLYVPLAPTFYAVSTYVHGYYSNYSAYLGTPPNEINIAP
ncbi:MAG: peptide ABC transporter substrate-binding protein [Clostridia bacterium]